MQITLLGWVTTHRSYQLALFETPNTLCKSQCPNWKGLWGTISTTNPHFKKSVIQRSYMARPKSQNISADGTTIRQNIKL